jgi:hypothetical protein
MLSKPLEDLVANLTHYTEARNWGSKSYNQIVPIEPGKHVSLNIITLSLTLVS